MKKIKFMAFFLSMALVFGSCGSMNNTAKGGMIGGGSGAALVRVKALLSVLLSVQPSEVLLVH